MQRFSQQIPWVLVEQDPQGLLASMYCEVCRASDRGHMRLVQAFAGAHRVHQAPRGSLRLGDAVAAIAKPVARAVGIDPNCSPCEARRRALNALRFGRGQ